MPVRVVAVELLFPSNPCPHCQTEVPGIPFCKNCQALQSFPRSASYFSLFDLSPALQINPESIQEKYYSWIKKLHPDRFTQSSEEQKKLSLLWSTQLNTAFKTFSKENLFEEYVLKFFGLKLPHGKTSLPGELLEAFFELEENPNEEFKKKLISDIEKEKNLIQEKVKQLNEDFQKNPEKKPQILTEWLNLIALKNYLNSMSEARGLK